MMDSVSRCSWMVKNRGHLGFWSQVVIIYIVVVTCIVNLSIANGNSNLWTALLSSSLGYLLPNPKLKKQTLGDFPDGRVPESDLLRRQTPG